VSAGVLSLEMKKSQYIIYDILGLFFVGRSSGWHNAV